MQLVIALVGFAGVVVGAVLTAALQYFFWKRQHHEELRSLEEREVRRERARAAERLREVAGLLIEINRGTLLGPHIDQTELITATLIENHRLRRELQNAAAAVRDAFRLRDPIQAERLDLFQRQLMEKVPLNLSQGSASALRSELDAIVDQLRALVSISDK